MALVAGATRAPGAGRRSRSARPAAGLVRSIDAEHGRLDEGLGPARLAFAQARELAPHGATAVALAPGWLRSELMLDHFG